PVVRMRSRVGDATPDLEPTLDEDDARARRMILAQELGGEECAARAPADDRHSGRRLRGAAGRRPARGSTQRRRVDVGYVSVSAGGFSRPRTLATPVHAPRRGWASMTRSRPSPEAPSTSWAIE